MAARYAPKQTSSSLPRLPRGVFLSLLIIAVPQVEGWCTALPGHVFFGYIVASCALSAGAWLVAASALESEADARRKEHVEQFIASEPGHEPPLQPHFESFPAWLRLWEGVNLAMYFFTVASILYSLGTLPNS